MRKAIYSRKEPARGVLRPCGNIEIGLRMPPDMFEEIRARAKKEGGTVSEIVRTYCEWGLEAEKSA